MAVGCYFVWQTQYWQCAVTLYGSEITMFFPSFSYADTCRTSGSTHQRGTLMSVLLYTLTHVRTKLKYVLCHFTARVLHSSPPFSTPSSLPIQSSPPLSNTPPLPSQHSSPLSTPSSLNTLPSPSQHLLLPSSLR